MRTTILLSVFVLLSGCLKDDPLNQSYHSFEPMEIGDGLVISDPEDEGMDAKKLNSVYESVYTNESLWSLRSLLVFRNNKLVSEAYLKDNNDITNRHLIWSSTKQVMGILAGIALDRELISSIDAPLSELLPEEILAHPEKSDITFMQLITMYSGIDFNNDGITGQTDEILRQIPNDITSFVLSLPLRDDPGTVFHYNDGDPQLVSSIIQRASGMPTDQWADDVFFSKAGVYNYNWVRYIDGTTLGGFGLETTPRELAKIALCVANNGRANGHQVIPEDWIGEMTTVRVEETFTGYSFGYYWWLEPSRGIRFMWGHGGQFAFVIPSKSLVVVMTSIPNTQGEYQIHADEVMPVLDQIIDACAD
jgi:CubicO group peptidase (beta-lactamase class C family)